MWPTGRDLEERVRLLEAAIIEHSRILSALCGEGSAAHARFIEREAAGDLGPELGRKSPRQSRPPTRFRKTSG